MNIEYINPFIEASQTVLKQIAGIDAKMGKVYLKESPYKSNSIIIIVGLTGQIRGQAMFSMTMEVGLYIASSMMGGMPVAGLDEMSKSALSELTNMILGNTATILYNNGTPIDITPPTCLFGDNLQISNNKLKIVCIPLMLGDGKAFEIDLAFEE
ncbi:chemotaxis protein CheX [Pseudobacteroides cellulosolvens]|uniref:Putative chemotaxis phosphatase, CheX n=1 Tax=Pseudobacteroides cellulosolvens ATCC 35603 = DSM 2933 TaxID=398512 RepID=A0A0L6JS88_9FIRM|nr:chemotaxis protein CheX [Pseudobacteroides cellulosolvens]KNY28585.1 putative chemotaxis phosphatase, CheX [Pseudobacteroides cellulosolvens ATCC 35603 = DSM 2933]